MHPRCTIWLLRLKSNQVQSLSCKACASTVLYVDAIGRHMHRWCNPNLNLVPLPISMTKSSLPLSTRHARALINIVKLGCTGNIMKLLTLLMKEKKITPNQEHKFYSFKNINKKNTRKRRGTWDLTLLKQNVKDNNPQNKLQSKLTRSLGKNKFIKNERQTCRPGCPKNLCAVKGESPRVEPDATQGKTRATLNFLIYSWLHSFLEKYESNGKLCCKMGRRFFQRVKSCQGGEKWSKEKKLTLE